MKRKWLHLSFLFLKDLDAEGDAVLLEGQRSKVEGQRSKVEGRRLKVEG